MTVATLTNLIANEPVVFPLRASTFTDKRDLVELLRQTCREAGADRYMLIDLVDRPNEPPRIIASNWIYDAIEMVGMTAVGRIAGSLVAGGRAAALGIEEQKLLARTGHTEIVGLPVRAGPRRYALLLSAEATGHLIDRAFAKARLVCSYALSLLAAPESSADAPVLSDRERECLYWVAEGKTTEEIALILSVSPNTANSYLSSAIQRLGARNRTLAVATAIRKGLI